MKNIFKGIVDKVFHKEKSQEEKENNSYEASNKGPIMPGLEETSEDVGKKVFEKTGRIREGVAQSSTTGTEETAEKANKAEAKNKVNKGIKKPEKKAYRGRKHKEKK